MIAGEQEVLAAQSQRADCILYAVVVNIVPAIQDLAAEAREKCIGVDQSLAHPGLGRKLVGDRVPPLLELLDDGI